LKVHPDSLMPLETFTSGESGHSVRRLVTSYGAAFFLVSGLLGGLALMPRSAEKEEAIVDIRLVVPPPPEPEPPPPPPKPLEVPKPKPAIKREIAKIEKAPEPPPTPEPPKPAPPAPAPLGLGQAKGPAKPGQATVSSGSTGGVVGGTGTGTGRVVPPASASAAPPPPKVVALSEDTEPPVALSQTAPAYPAALKAEGIEGFVVVRFLVTEAGTVDDVRVVKSSDPRFNDGVLATVKTWRFKPATSQGKPVPYPKTVKIPFKIRT
jgi:protein TonB